MSTNNVHLAKINLTNDETCDFQQTDKSAPKSILIIQPEQMGKITLTVKTIGMRECFDHPSTREPVGFVTLNRRQETLDEKLLGGYVPETRK